MLFKWKYFQYISLLFTEIYLDRYFSDREAFCTELNGFLADTSKNTPGKLPFAPYTPAKMNKLAFMCATGSGKTLIMHMNILQFMHYFKRAQRLDSRLNINKVIVLAPNEGMSRQHLEELALSSIFAAMFEKDRGLSLHRESVIVIDMNKLKEEGKVKTVSVDNFERDNLVLVDEGHRGLTGNIWYDYRSRLSAEGFAFEYSATFKQVLSVNSKKPDERALMEEYGKSIIMDYSYKYFYGDGYGKDYRIYNMRKSAGRDQLYLYLTGCLLSFYQQMKLFEVRRADITPFHIEKPLLVFVGNRVTASTSASELTDIEEALDFIDSFVRRRANAVALIQAVLHDDTGLIDSSGNELFYQDFYALSEIYGHAPDAAEVYADILRVVFNTDASADELRMHMEGLRQVPGEIGLRIGEYGKYFGVISIGDAARLIRNCEKRGMVARTEEFVSESLFHELSSADSKINVLIGSRKFTEGWNNWRVSTMCLINFARGEGAQAIQLFGRGVRLKGFDGCLKRSRRLDRIGITPPKNLELLETLTIFGIKAQYMEEFRRYLELEGAPVNDSILEFRLPVKSRLSEAKDIGLRTIRVKDGADFKKQARRLVLDAPDEGFLSYLTKNKTLLDCRTKIQTVDSTLSMKIVSSPEELTLPENILPYLDYDRIFDELEQYKNEKHYYNICIIKEKLSAILKAEGWYALLIPKNQLTFDSAVKLAAAADYAVMALKSYIKKFYRYEKERWEALRLEFAELTDDGGNFFDEYTITYARQHEADRTGGELKDFLSGAAAELGKNGRLGAFEKSALHGCLTLLDYPLHLYSPLICLQKSNMEIQASPVGLNEGEKRFVELLRDFTDTHTELLSGKALRILRNRSRIGLGFFEAADFYPDFILWIDTENVQYISFIDPKGLTHFSPGDPKIEFYKTIKALEKRLAPSSGDKKIVLNSFIMSVTPDAQLRLLWGMDRREREAKNVYTLDSVGCIESMIGKILS